jgi:hypothetical protein
VAAVIIINVYIQYIQYIQYIHTEPTVHTYMHTYIHTYLGTHSYHVRAGLPVCVRLITELFLDIGLYYTYSIYHHPWTRPISKVKPYMKNISMSCIADQDSQWSSLSLSSSSSSRLHTLQHVVARYLRKDPHCTTGMSPP